MLSENEGDGELGGSVMELIRLGPLSILPREKERERERRMKEYHIKNEHKCAEFADQVINNR